MTKPGLTLRPAQQADCTTTWAWANDPQTRRGSFNSAAIETEEHQRWFELSLDGARHLFIAEIDHEPVGLLRFDPMDHPSASAEIGITVAPAMRGRGVARDILSAGNVTGRRIGLTKLIARVRLDNPAGIKVFESAGFETERDETVDGIHARIFARRIDDD